MIRIPKLNKLKFDSTIDFGISFFENDFVYLLPSLKFQVYNFNGNYNVEICIEWLLFCTYICIGKFRE